MRIASLHTYPVKGCHRIDHDAAEVEPWGLAGDRRWLIVTAHDQRFVSQRTDPRLALVRPAATADGLRLSAPGQEDLVVPTPRDGEVSDVTVWNSTVAATFAGKAADDWLSAFLGLDVRLVWLDDPTRRTVNPAFSAPSDRVSFADGYPLLLANAASLDAVNDWLAETGADPVPMTRFRPNVVLTGAAPWAEDAWVGGRIRLGGVTFRVAKPAGRCLVITTDQETGERGHEPLRTLARRRTVNQQVLFAVLLIPDAPGRLAVGDPAVVP